MTQPNVGSAVINKFIRQQERWDGSSPPERLAVAEKLRALGEHSIAPAEAARREYIKLPDDFRIALYRSRII